MPQMSPLWWEILFLVFIMSFMLMNTIIFYNKKMLPKQKSIEMIKINQFKWKW
uniref:ATP synthase complex subunit 8 n=1 Tax=Cletus punctiger TaxID=299285 RepID=A0A7L7YX54_9HEMI|nr:ATP synthase F0 subunit 8 [Cletus punctiger]QOD41603.1 ATP synthase F0 subunit 8 [Cletus punctiger]